MNSTLMRHIDLSKSTVSPLYQEAQIRGIVGGWWVASNTQIQILGVRISLIECHGSSAVTVTNTDNHPLQRISAINETGASASSTGKYGFVCILD